MKKLITLTFAILTLTSCSSDDDSGNSGSQTVNIKFEVITSRNTDAIITTTINNDTQTDEVEDLPFNRTVAQQEVESGDYLKLTYLENGTYAPIPPNWTDYTATLTIYINNNVVKTQDFEIVSNTGIVQIEYTF